MLCNDEQREGAKLSPDLTSGLFCYVLLHKIWYGIASNGKAISLFKDINIVEWLAYHYCYTVATDVATPTIFSKQ